MKSFIEKYKPKLEEIPQQKLIKKIRENVISSIPIKFERNREKKRMRGKMKLVITSLIDLINLRLKI